MCQLAITSAVTVTPASTAIDAFDGLYIGGAGNLDVTLISGERVVFNGVLAGTIYPIKGYIVHPTTTTATNIKAIYN